MFASAIRPNQSFATWGVLGRGKPRPYERLNDGRARRGGQGRLQPGPGDDNDPVKMVRHHLKDVQYHGGKPHGKGSPRYLHDPAGLAQHHLVLQDLPEEGAFILDAHRDEIRYASTVVVPAQTNGTPVMNPGIVGHAPIIP